MAIGLYEGRGISMSGIAAILGLLLAVFGFLVMRNPMRLAIFAPGQEGYYQRMVLDSSLRNQLRVLGVLLCLFGASILTASVGAILKTHFLKSISEGLWVLMGCVFIAVWVVGLVLGIRDLVKGKLLDSFRLWKTAMRLGAIDVFPLITPKMEREAFFFTVVLCALACMVVVVSLLR